MSNIHGYSDYHGPSRETTASAATNGSDIDSSPAIEEDEEDETNPLQVGFWIPGDSLAPPCGTEISTIHRFLDFCNASSQDVLYDLGCGDGRICLEAHAGKWSCKATVGVEIEQDLVQRARDLVNGLDEHYVGISFNRRPFILRDDLRNTLQYLSGTLRQGGGGDDDEKKDHASGANDTTNVIYANLPFPTIITLYLLPESILTLTNYWVDLLKQCPAPGFRIACIEWGIPSLQPVKTQTQHDKRSGATTCFYLYTKDSLTERKGALD